MMSWAKGQRKRRIRSTRYDLYWRGGKWEQVARPKPAPEPTPPEDTEPQEQDVQRIPETELAVMEGMVDMQTRLAALEAKLKGGE